MKLFGLLGILGLFEILQSFSFKPRPPLAANSIQLSKKSMQPMLDGLQVKTFMKPPPLKIFQNSVELFQMQFTILNVDFQIDLDKISKLSKISQQPLTLEQPGQTAL